MIRLQNAFGGNNNRLYVGYDLGDNTCQISYSLGGTEVETVAAVAGTEQYSIPTVLCKREGVNQWFYGREALRYSQENGGILVDHLLSKAMDGEPVSIDGNSYQPISLLTLFLKRTISLLVQSTGIDKVEAILFTTKDLDHSHLEILREAVDGLKLKTQQIYFQKYTESFYYYMVQQPESLWHQGALLLDYEEDRIYEYHMEANKRTTPIVVYISENESLFTVAPRSNVVDLEYELGQMDRTFLNIAREACESDATASVFLVGEQFSEQWMKESLRYLCGKYRVFQGNNLYSKGACYGLLDRTLGTEAGRTHVFLGNDKLSSNIGMNIYRQGREIYFALLDAGVNWFEAKQSFDFYLQGGDYIELQISSLVGGGNRLARITLEDFSGSLTRLRANLFLESEKILTVEIEDLGLGSFRTASGRTWIEKIDLN